MSWCFVVGTDTGVGKTSVSAALLSAGRSLGHSTLGIKPFETGCVPVDGGWEGLDARSLAAASTVADDGAGFVRLERPASPLAAARSAGTSIDREKLVSAIRARTAGEVDLGIVEGAGGLLVPMGEDWVLADLLVELGLPVLVVGRAGLGAVNHALLTLEALERRAVRVVGFVLNDADVAVKEWFAKENGAEIERISGAVFLGHSRRGTVGRAVLAEGMAAAVMVRLRS